MAKARVFEPRVEVLLTKNAGRRTVDGAAAVSDRFSGAQRVIDLAPWLTDASSIRTSKSVRQPAGTFALVLSDRRHPQDLDSLYGLIEPMDLVEIRLAHEPHAARGGRLPLVMRGVVSDVRRSEAMTGAGKPARQVIVSGQDFGLFWQILQVFYMPNYSAGANLLTQFRAFTQYGVGFEPMPARQFLREVVDRVLNPFIDEMRRAGEGGSNADLSPLSLLTAEDADIQGSLGTVSPFGINQWQGGAIYQLLSSNLDVGPWCELFIEDREDGAHVIYRNNPYYDMQGDRIGAFTDPPTFVVAGEDIVSMNVARSHGDVANYFWVDAPRFSLNSPGVLQAMAAAGEEETFFVQAHRNCDPRIFGVRKMWVQTEQGAPAAANAAGGLPEREHAATEVDSSQWIEARRRELIAHNRDNGVLESGTMRIRGREEIKAGSYVVVRRGLMVSRYYVPAVSHEFVPFVGFFTTLTLERGTGFVERVQRNGGMLSPYNSELHGV